jgi:signal transduction histidine kinase
VKGQGDVLVALAALADHLPVDIWVRDAEHRLIYANPTCLEHFPDAMGQRTEEHDVPQAVQERWKYANERALAGHQVSEELRYGQPGTPGFRVVMNVVLPIQRDGRIIGTVGVNIDQTAQYDAERRASERDAIIRAVFDSTRALMGIREIVSDDDVLLVADNRLSNAYNQRPDDAEPILQSKLGTPLETRRAAVKLARLAMDRGHPIDFEVSTLQPGKGLRMFQGKVAPIDRAPGDPERFFYLAEDITEQRDLEARLLRAEQLSTFGALAATVAQEIKNPATTLLLSVQSLRRAVEDLPGIDPETRELLLHLLLDAETGTEHVAELVKNLGKLTMPAPDVMSEVDLSEVVRSAISLGRATLPPVVVLRLDLEARNKILGNGMRLAELVLHLVNNAVEATQRAGSGFGRIEIRTTDLEEGGVMLTVSDDGPGLNDTVRYRLFQPFVTTSKASHGLGLFTCKQTTEAHGGTIALVDRPGGGTMARVELPGARP